MRRLLEQAGFKGKNAARFVQHIHLSGGFNEPIFSALCELIGITERKKKIFQKAVTESRSKDGQKFNAETFLHLRTGLSFAESWVFILASTQRFFQDQVVVSQQQPTDYSASCKDAILKLADEMGLREPRRIEAGSTIHYGVCFGATTGAANDYLLRHKRIARERNNKDEPYTLFMFCGERKLSRDNPNDNPTNSSAAFSYGEAGESRDYLTYLAGKYPEGTVLKEGHMMKDRYEAVLGGEAINLVIIEGSSTIKDTAAFMGEVARRLKDAPHDQVRTLAITSYDIFNRTYQAMMQTALKQQGIGEKIAVECDGGVCGSRDKPQTIIREMAKIIYAVYHQVAIELGFRGHDPAQFSGKAVREMEERARKPVAVVAAVGGTDRVGGAERQR